MKLLDFYRDLFDEATSRFEPVWEVDEDYTHGFKWTKENYPIQEQFRITDMGDEPPIVMFSVALPDMYAETNVFDEVYRYPTHNEMSIVIMNRKVWVNASLCTSKMEHSVLGFVHRARSEIMNIFDCAILTVDVAHMKESERYIP
ncbi:hypothetical protein [Paenibacillus sp. CF384]|uniref:hypothetical protein n=1 Tax=Paenibacillus sp. CF384 TaxID=1884382 RepID=UPI0008992876|nr:hypothetical protein [Paenibacillus sp. CF384]SDW54712.1 hypothetical protein SAMN05518855_100341 [Paenibacillus sp. CF384]